MGSFVTGPTFKRKHQGQRMTFRFLGTDETIKGTDLSVPIPMVYPSAFTNPNWDQFTMEDHHKYNTAYQEMQKQILENPNGIAFFKVMRDGEKVSDCYTRIFVRII